MRKLYLLSLFALFACQQDVELQHANLIIWPDVGEEERAAWYEGAYVWNDAFGETVVNDDVSKPTAFWIRARRMDFDDDGAIGLHKRQPGGWSAVWMKEGLPEPMRIATALHELGHAFNLRYSKDINSVMFESLAYDEETGETRQTLQPEDVMNARLAMGLEPRPHTVGTLRAPLVNKTTPAKLRVMRFDCEIERALRR